MSQLFASGGQNIELLHQSFQWIFRVPLGWTGLISLKAVHGTLKSLLQHHNSKASVLQCSAFFMVQLAHDYWKNHSFDYTGLGWQVTSLLFNTLSRFVKAFLSRSKHLLISWLQSPFTVILEAKKMKSVSVSTFSHLFAMKWWDWLPWSYPYP